MRDEVKSFETFIENEEWFDAHIDELASEFTDKFLAVVDPGDFRAENDLKRLLTGLEEEGVDLESVFIAAIPPIGVASIV